MPEDLFSITLVMTDRQLRHLRQAVANYATERHQGRMERLAHGSGETRPSRVEKIADEVERRVFRACEVKFPMGKEPADAMSRL